MRPGVAAAVEQQRVPSAVAAEVGDRTHHDEVIPAGVGRFDLTVDPRADAIQDGASQGRRSPRDTLELVCAGPRESRAEALLILGQYITQKRPVAAIAGQLVELRPGSSSTRDGFNESAENDWHVKPTGPCAVRPVTVVIPEGKCPSTDRNRAGSMVDVIGLVLGSGVASVETATTSCNFHGDGSRNWPAAARGRTICAASASQRACIWLCDSPIER